MSGCPLDEKISAAHTVARVGDLLGALAIIIVDNPMCPGSGHRRPQNVGEPVYRPRESRSPVPGSIRKKVCWEALA